MVEVVATIRNAMGIHCRPSATIVREARIFEGDIEVIAPGGTCDPRSIMGLISLALTEGTIVTIRLSGSGSKEFAPKIVELFERHFDFTPNPDTPSPLRRRRLLDDTD
jgi:phosphotransferase system HPr (HPr) family protein